MEALLPAGPRAAWRAARPETRTSLALLAGGALPFCAARVATDLSSAAGDGAGLPCGFRALTGLPCPLCGTTRALALTTRGSAAALHYNAVWVLALALAALAGVVGLLAPAAARRLPRPRGRPALVLGLAVTALAWAWALAHRGAILG